MLKVRERERERERGTGTGTGIRFILVLLSSNKLLVTESARVDSKLEKEVNSLKSDVHNSIMLMSMSSYLCLLPAST